MRIIVSRAPRGESLRFLCWGGIGDTKILRKRKGEGEVLLLLSSLLSLLFLAKSDLLRRVSSKVEAGSGLCKIAKTEGL